MSTSIGLAYVPVIHKGYVEFCNVLKERSVTTLYIVGDDILECHEELDYINRKDRLRAVAQKDISKALHDITGLEVVVLTTESIPGLVKEGVRIVTPNEDISRFITETYFKDQGVEYIDIFLRWNKDNVGEDKEPEAVAEVILSDFQKKVFADVVAEAAKSFDWWRQVGAAIVKDGEVVIVTHNEHMPEETQQNTIGDTRALFKKGVHINYVTTAHAEGAAIAEAAKKGLSTEGAELYVTDFPCPYCARIIAKSGIKKVYFKNGYAVLDGDNFFKEEGIEVIKVKE